MLHKVVRVAIFVLFLILEEQLSVEIPHVSQTYLFYLLSNSVQSLTVSRHLILPHHHPLDDLVPLSVPMKWLSVDLSTFSLFSLSQAPLISLGGGSLDHSSGLKSELIPLGNPTYSPPPKLLLQDTN